jgi:hypothetical protein
VTPLEALPVVSVCFGWFVAISINAMLSGFPVGAFTDGSSLDVIVVDRCRPS